MTIKVEFNAGTDLETAYEETRILSNKLSCNVEFNFNGAIYVYNRWGTALIGKSKINSVEDYMAKVKNDFVWTDSLVASFANWYKVAQGQTEFWGKDLLEYFKFNHSFIIKK